MTPRDFYAKWDVTYEQISHICDRSLGTVQCWFNRGQGHRPPKPVDLRHLAIMDFLLEHFEEIPEKLRTILCSP
ncbi:MAG: helix-turn-helix domain-containing protein [Coleofasciculus sp. A1-SPW-01]